MPSYEDDLLNSSDPSQTNGRFREALAKLRARRNDGAEKNDNRSDRRVAKSVYRSAMNKMHPGYLSQVRASWIFTALNLGLSVSLLGVKVHEYKTEKVIIDDMATDNLVICLVLMLISLLTGLSLGLDLGRRNVNDEGIIREASDLIVKFNEKFPSSPMIADTKQIERLLDVLPSVIQHIEPKDRKKLEDLARNKGAIPDESYFQKVAEIMSTHLEKDSEDLNMLVNAYKGIITLDASKKYWSNGFEPVR